MTLSSRRSLRRRPTKIETLIVIRFTILNGRTFLSSVVDQLRKIVMPRYDSSFGARVPRAE